MTLYIILIRDPPPPSSLFLNAVAAEAQDAAGRTLLYIWGSNLCNAHHRHKRHKNVNALVCLAPLYI